MPRRNLNYHEKFKLIQNKSKNTHVNQLISEFKVSRATVFRILNNTEKVIKTVNGCKGKMRRIVGSVDSFDEKIINYVKQMNEFGFPVTSMMLKLKAKRLAATENKGLVGSNGWLDCFKKRCNIKHGRLSGESASTNMEVVAKFKDEIIPTLLLKYPPQSRYNLDETAIFYRQLPAKTYFVSKTAHFGSKISKERVSILIGCNHQGEKLIPMIIGKSKNPRAFKANNSELQNLQLIYKSNNSAWMTLNLFDSYLSEWHKELIEKDEKIALIIDNFAGHKVDENKFPNIQFFWLPPGTTSHLQPMDNGIIKCFKNKYVKHLFQRFSDYLDQNMSLNDIMKNINLFDALKWINDSWSEVSIETIINCWNHAGYREEIVDEQLITENIESNDDDDNISQIYDQLTTDIKDSPTLVEYMDRLTMTDLNTYSVSEYDNSRSL